MKDFRNLQVWEKSHQLTLAVYSATRTFPQSELFGLTSQIRRSASSIPANIAEGCGRGSNAEFARSLQIAMGSASELEYHLLLSRDLGLIGGDAFASLSVQVVEVKRMLAALISKIRAESRHPAPR